jgi:hypothetical protein
MRSRTVLLFTAIVLSLVFCVDAAACVCAGEPSVRTAFKESAAVFTGTFIRAEFRKGIRSEMQEIANDAWGKKGQPYEVEVYIFQVDTWWKGAGTREVMLITDSTRAPDGSTSVSDCGLGFDEGEKYLVYASQNGDNISAGACSRTASISHARGDIIKLDSIRRGKKVK